METNSHLNVSLGTEHTVYRISKFWYLAISYFLKAIYLFTGLYISNRLYKECLLVKDCNSIVTTYFCILGLACFANVGLPIEKLVNVKFSPTG